jgi:DNA-binding response OmpR family regulator
MAKRKILIADDDVEFTELLSQNLEYAGYETVIAYEGVRTVEAANKHLPDLIILDWKMPAGMGSDVLIDLKKKRRTRHIPVIVITGMDNDTIERDSIRLGARVFMKKPFDPHTLVHKIHELIEIRLLEESLDM